MFAKLLKHEWRSRSGLMGILSLGALGLGIMGAVILRMLVVNGDVLWEDENLAPVTIMLVMTLVFMALALVIYVAAVEILWLIRFYQNKFTDQGYLTFTLPVSCHQLFLSSLLVIVAWQVIASLVVGVTVFIVLLFGTATKGLVNPEVFSWLGMIWEDIRWIYGYYDELGSYMFLTVAQYLVGLFSGPVIAMTCVTVGAVVAKKHKILVAIGIYYGSTFVISTVSSALSMMVTLAVTAMGTGTELILNISSIVEILLQLGLLIGGYFLSTSLMHKKLNLP